MQITAADVMKLRKMTSAGMMDCKNALTEAEGDFEKAVDIIREKGKLVAAKRADRETTEGAVLVRINGGKAIIVCLGCETDFVSATPDFKALANGIADAAIAAFPADAEALKAVQMPNGHTVEEEISAQTGKTGEKHVLAYYSTLDLPENRFCQLRLQFPDGFPVQIRLPPGGIDHHVNMGVIPLVVERGVPPQTGRQPHGLRQRLRLAPHQLFPRVRVIISQPLGVLPTQGNDRRVNIAVMGRYLLRRFAQLQGHILAGKQSVGSVPFRPRTGGNIAHIGRPSIQHIVVILQGAADQPGGVGYRRILFVILILQALPYVREVLKKLGDQIPLFLRSSPGGKLCGRHPGVHGGLGVGFHLFDLLHMVVNRPVNHRRGGTPGGCRLIIPVLPGLFRLREVPEDLGDQILLLLCHRAGKIGIGDLLHPLPGGDISYIISQVPGLAVFDITDLHDDACHQSAPC